MSHRVRPATEADLARIRAIYAHHVLTGVASFETEPPDLAEMTARWRRIAEAGLPYLVAETDGAVLGYAYAGRYHTRPGYRYALEDSVYVADGARRRGIGGTLLAELILRSEPLGCRQMVAVIGDSGNAASIALHRRAGFRHVGTLDAIGFKLGRWVDVVVMQRALGPGRGTLPEPPD